MKRQRRRRLSLRAQQDGILVEAEDHIRRSREATPGMVSTLLERIGAFYGQIFKLDKAICDETADDLVNSEMLDAGQHHEKVVSAAASVRLMLKEFQSSTTCAMSFHH